MYCYEKSDNGDYERYEYFVPLSIDIFSHAFILYGTS